MEDDLTLAVVKRIPGVTEAQKARRRRRRAVLDPSIAHGGRKRTRIAGFVEIEGYVS